MIAYQSALNTRIDADGSTVRGRFPFTGSGAVCLDRRPPVEGGARELHSEERDYLETRFHPTDGARPYVKRRYSQLNAGESWLVF